MNSEKTRSSEQIFNDMHRELRQWNPDTPESPDRMDPILRIMLKLYSSQLAKIDKKVESTWKSASNALIKALCPESMRWPIPAHTVMRAEPSDPVIKVDPQTRFFYREERDQGQTFFFSSLRTEKIVKATMKNIYFTAGNTVLDLSPLPPDSTQVSARPQSSSFSGAESEIYIAIEHDGHSTDFEDSLIFLQGKAPALKLLRWSRWLPGIDGSFYDDGYFCPGQAGSLDDIFTDSANAAGTIDWGGLRKSADLFKPLEDNFVMIPRQFATAWRPGKPDHRLEKLLESAGITPPEKADQLYWIKIILPPGGDKSVFQSSFELMFNCFIAVNKNELSLFKHTGGNRLIEIEIPEHLDNILEITSVADSNGNSYLPRHEALSSNDNKFYTLLERNERVSLWFDFSAEIELPPDSITVNYSITGGASANGISAGKIKELYENHPGLASIVNITPVLGAIPAKTEEQIVTEVSARLRGRDRALSFDQLVNWTKTFDRRIKGAGCERGVMRTKLGVRKCVVVKVTIDEKDFYSDDEIELLINRLGSFLKARSSINSQFKLEIVKQ